MATKKPENLTFEAAMLELEALVKQLEEGQLPLADALKKFERGVALARSSKDKLDQAEQQVKVLLEKNGEFQLKDFQADPE